LVYFSSLSTAVIKTIQLMMHKQKLLSVLRSVQNTQRKANTWRYVKKPLGLKRLKITEYDVGKETCGLFICYSNIRCVRTKQNARLLTQNHPSRETKPRPYINEAGLLTIIPLGLVFFSTGATTHCGVYNLQPSSGVYSLLAYEVS
jgi:hypothetical protein